MARVVIHQGALNALLVSGSGGVSQYLVRQGIRVENAAKVFCPVDTGRLRSSIAISTEQTAGGTVVKVGTNVEYAAYVELGTRFQRAQPYLAPALRQVMGRL